MLSKIINLHKYIPNVISFLSIVSGAFSIKYAINDDFRNACLMIIAGGFFDFIDGFLARKLNVSSKSGELMDTLCDFSTFGFASFVICGIFWKFSMIFLISGFLYLAAITYRLIRFTTHPQGQKDFFLGIPAPIASIFFLFPIIFFVELGIPKNKFTEIILFIYNIFISLSAVSNIKMISNKNFSNLKKILHFENKKMYLLLSPLFFLFVFLLFKKPIIAVGLLLIIYYITNIIFHFSLKRKQNTSLS